MTPFDRIPNKPDYKPMSPVERRQAVLGAGVPVTQVKAILAGRPFTVLVSRRDYHDHH